MEDMDTIYIKQTDAICRKRLQMSICYVYNGVSGLSGF
jgi:hypothetical protein